jgi:hypothetical protein
LPWNHGAVSYSMLYVDSVSGRMTRKMKWGRRVDWEILHLFRHICYSSLIPCEHNNLLWCHSAFHYNWGWSTDYIYCDLERNKEEGRKQGNVEHRMMWNVTFWKKFQWMPIALIHLHLIQPPLVVKTLLNRVASSNNLYINKIQLNGFWRWCMLYRTIGFYFGFYLCGLRR